MKAILIFIILFFIYGFSFSAHSQSKQKSKEEKIDLSRYSQATFASGCFWCMQALFESVKGVKEAVAGYAGGTVQNPTYELVGGEKTGHAETVQVYYDPKIVSYETLLKVYFGSEDPTQINGQGPDEGSSYRSIIFYRSKEEKKQAETYIAELQKKYVKRIATQVVPFTKFWRAEPYHQHYIDRHPHVRYVQQESIPRIKKFQHQFPDLIKADHKF